MVRKDTDGKLVRDRIPEIIEAAGGQATARLLDQAERLPALLAKLQEESDELRAAASPAGQSEELADVLEVLPGRPLDNPPAVIPGDAGTTPLQPAFTG